MNTLWLLAACTLGTEPEPEWTLRTSTAEPRYAQTITLAEKWALPGEVKAGELVQARRYKPPTPAWPSVPHVVLLDGTRLVATLVDANDKALFFERTIGEKKQKITVPLMAVDLLWLGNLPAGTPAYSEEFNWLVTPRKKDTVLLSNGDSLKCSLDRFEDAGKIARVRQESGGLAKAIPTNTITAIALDPTLARVKPAKDPTAMFVLLDGSRLHFANAVSEEDRITGTLVAGGKVTVAWSEVVTIDVLGGAGVFLHELKPKSQKADPLWPTQINKSAKGKPITLSTERGREQYDRGIGLHANAEITYDLSGKYNVFETSLGMDASTGRQGEVAVEVLVDGKAIIEPKLNSVTYSGGTVSVRVNVKDAKELTIKVLPGPSGDVQGDVNLGNARLIK